MENIKTLEELFIKQYEEKSAEVESLKTALDGAKHTIEALIKKHERLGEIFKPTVLRTTADKKCFYIRTEQPWDSFEPADFTDACELLGLAEEYKKLKEEDVEE